MLLRPMLQLSASQLMPSTWYPLNCMLCCRPNFCSAVTAAAVMGKVAGLVAGTPLLLAAVAAAASAEPAHAGPREGYMIAAILVRDECENR